MTLHLWQRMVLHPVSLLAWLSLGAVFGTLLPDYAKLLEGISRIYVDLISMIVLPFLMSSIVFSLQNLIRSGNSKHVFGMLSLVFVVGTLLTAFISLAIAVGIQYASGISQDSLDAMGRIVGMAADRSNTIVALLAADVQATSRPFNDFISILIPTNVFAALANGETLKVLVFALTFGIAAGHVPGDISDSLNKALETIYRACQTIAKWTALPLPLIIFCMSSSQIATAGWDPILAMARFVFVFSGISALLFSCSILVLARQSKCNVGQVLNAFREAIALAIATNNIAVCMPAMVDALCTHLTFMRSRVELLIPIAAAMFRAGAVAYFVCATLFVAEIYQRELTAMDCGVLVVAAWITGFATGGMTGLVTLSMVASICAYIKLPFEAAFVLFAAVDPLCTILRTTVNMIGACAAVSMTSFRNASAPF